MENKEIDRQKLVLEIMALAYAVHENTDYCIFIDYSGHVDSLTISIRESKKNWQTRACDSEVYAKQKTYSDNDFPEPHLQATRDVLKGILESGEIDYSALQKEVEEVYRYRF